MSASAPQVVTSLRPMQASDVDGVVAIESEIYAFPWTHGNFADSLAAGYSAWVLDGEDGIVGYSVAMSAVDEVHLLNITVARAHQAKGLGRRLMSRVIEGARERGMQSVLLEVRPSNPTALAFYRRLGYDSVGRRRGYYPAQGGREDAIVMRLAL